MQDKRNIENVVQEIMGLVSHAMDRAMWAGELILDEDRVHFESRFEEANDARSLIESKLREIVENSFSVREPLRDDAVTILDHKEESEHLQDVVWMDSDTYAALQGTTSYKKTRWPVYKLSEWDDKQRFVALSPRYTR